MMALILTAPLAASAAESAESGKTPARTDSYGDPLPQGAIRRLGTLRFHCGWGIRNLLPTPDGKTLISNEAAGTASLWDLATGRLLRQFPGNLHQQSYIALSPDGKLLAIGYPQVVIVWDLASGKEVRRLAQKDATGVAFAPDGKTLAAAGNGADKDGIHLWDLSTGKKIATLPWKRGNRISSVLITYTPDGKTVIAGQWFNSKIGLWDVASGKKRRELDAQAGAVFSLALSPNGAILAAGSQKSSIHLWDVKTGQLIRTLHEEGGKDCMESVAFSPDGKNLAAIESDEYTSAGKDHRCIHIWDVATGKELSRFKGGSRLRNIVYSRDGKTLIVAALGSIRLLDAATGKDVGATAGSSEYLCFGSGMRSADGSTLAYLRQSEVRSWQAKADRGVSSIAVRFWDMKANRELARAIEFDCFYGCLTYALSPNGRIAAVSDDQNAINLWDVRSGKRIRCLQQGQKGRPNAHVLAFSPDGRMLASTDNNAVGVRIWDVGTGKQVRWLPLAKATDAREGSNWRGATAIAFTPDGKRMAASGLTWAGGSGVRIWEVATGKELPHLTQVMNAPTQEDTPRSPGYDPWKIIVPRVVFSPNGTMLAKNGRSKTIPIWEAATGQQRLLLKGHEDSTVFVAFAPDSRTLASASWDNTIRLWDLDTGRQLRKLTGHRGKANTLAFSAEGKTLVSAGDDTTVLFWDVAELTRRKRPHLAPLAKKEWQALWDELVKDDAATAYAAMIRMAADAPTTIAALQERLHPIRPADPKKLARLLKELDSDEFAVRESASRELTKLGDVAGPAVRQMLARPGLSLELRRRLQTISTSLGEISGECLRQVRAVEVLELIGTTEARELLKALSAGVAEVRLTEQAKAALERLAKPEGK